MPEAPAYVRRNAQRGLRLLEFAGDGLQPATVRAARRMAEGTVSDQKARLMGPWFARHEGDLDSPRARAYLAGDSERPTAGQVAWLLWGGDISGDVMRAARWARRQTESNDRSTPSGVIDSPETHVAPLEAPPASYGHPASTRHPITTTKKGATVRLLDQLVEERAELSETVDGILTRAADESRDLNETEDKNLADLKARADALDERITELRAVQVANLEAAKLRAEVAATDEPEARAAAGVVQVHSEPITYSERSNHSFFSDMYHAQTYGDRDAQARLERHRDEMAVEHRDGSSANYAGLVVPQYLTQLAAELARAGRPFADQCTSLPLPADGLTVNISRVTTGSSAAVQAAENDAVSETDIDDTLLTADVRTIAAGQQLSRQAVERGTGVDALVAADMLGAMATTLDNQLLNGSGSSGQLLGLANVAGINSVTYTDASPTAAELYSKIVDGIQQVNSNRYAGADLIVMHPRRLAFLQAGVDSSNRPLVVPSQNVPQNAMGVGPVAGYGNTGASIAGLPVVTDANIITNGGTGTNEDEIYIVRRADMLLFEDAGAPALVRMDQTAGLNLTVTMVAYQYATFIPGRYPASISKISGTGLVAPTF